MGILNTYIVDTSPGIDGRGGQIHPFSLPAEASHDETSWLDEIRRRWRLDPAFRQYAYVIARATHEIDYRGPYASQARIVVAGLRQTFSKTS